MTPANAHAWRRTACRARPLARFTAPALEAMRSRARAKGFVLRCQGAKVFLLRFGGSIELESVEQLDRILGDVS